MNADHPADPSIESIRRQYRQRLKLAAMPPEKALETIMESGNPAGMVRAMPEQDFHLLIHDLGLENALQLLSMAATRQWEYILDLEAWHQDTPNYPALDDWLQRLYRANPARLTRWLMYEHSELAHLYLARNIEIRLREHDEDPSGFPEGFFSHDGTLFVRIADPTGAGDGDPMPAPEKKRRIFLRELVDRMAGVDFDRYYNLILEATHVIPAEQEEECYRRRNIRLQEKGFLPFEEAIGIYQPVTPAQLAGMPAKRTLLSDRGLPPMPVPVSHTVGIAEDTLFGRALGMLSSPQTVEDLQIEFAALCNRLIVADQKTITDRRQLDELVQKACGYLDIALERLAGPRGETDLNQAAGILEKRPLAALFSVGYERVARLKWQTERWHAGSWYRRNALPMTFWGEQWTGALGGLLLRNPLYFDNYQTGVIYREFAAEADVAETARVLAEIQALDGLLDKIVAEPVPRRWRGRLSCANLLLTLWARHRLALTAAVAPVTVASARQFFGWLWQQDRKPFSISDHRKRQMLDWLAEAARVPADELSDTLGPALERLFGDITEEYGEVAVEDLQARYLTALLVEDDPAAGR